MAILPKKSTGFDRCCSIDRFEIILTTAARDGNGGAKLQFAVRKIETKTNESKY